MEKDVTDGDGVLRIEVPGIRSLQWGRDGLIDWAGGGNSIHLDGKVTGPRVHYAFGFDASVVSPGGEFAVIYVRQGTKGLVLRDGKIVREINRSFYCADAYEYPIALFQATSGSVMLAHCPDSYCRLELEDILSGERSPSSAERKPADHFYSRLRVSPDGRWLLSAGWFWHPWGTLALFDLAAGLRDSLTLDRAPGDPPIEGEVAAAEFMSNGHVLVSTSAETLNGEPPQEGVIGPNALSVIDPLTRTIVSSTPVQESVGMLMPIDSRVAVGFYGHPKLFSLQTGEVLKRWTAIDSGTQNSSISVTGETWPPIACDPVNGRFAVGDSAGLTIVNLVEEI